MSMETEKLYENHRRCPSCGYFADVSKWHQLDIFSFPSTASIVCKKYDKETGKQINGGKVELLSCPECRIVIL